MLLEYEVHEAEIDANHRLCRFDNHMPFAYLRGYDVIRASDHTLWARMHDGSLVSAASGELIAYRRGTIFYDAETRQPVYYQRS